MTSGPKDRTPGLPGSDKNISISLSLNYNDLYLLVMLVLPKWAENVAYSFGVKYVAVFMALDNGHY